ncbi:MFS transporter [Azospirillum canadense]|uniref:MFS transporter n=1 Tax=Azospirillum canadense TaxID=403962 RepID=UPI002226D3A3|nr:MFS transporter [Azospirillum canadense]MCW2241945.1 MFS family permease [Azospirillum canadense]
MMGRVEDGSRRRPMLRVILASSAGTIVEWYDFFIYATLAVFLADIFFPKGDPIAGVLLSVGTFATGYLLRPLGGLFFGAMGDRIGRKRTFVITMLIMGASTVAIGLLPTYEHVGLLAPVLLIILRMMQGIALGGEYGGAAIYVAENASPREMGYWTGWIQTTAGIGLLCATGVTLLVRSSTTAEQFASWGWRLPFLMSLALVLISLWIRAGAEESPVFREMERRGTLEKSPVKAALTDGANLRAMLVALFGVSAGVAAMSGILFLYCGIFLQAILKADAIFVSMGLAGGILIGIPFFPIMGGLSDRFGRRRVIFTGLALNALLLFPIFFGLEHAVLAHSIALLVALVAALTVLFAAIYGPYAAFMSEQFPPQMRYTSVSLPFNIAFSLIGGLLPLVCLTLVRETGYIHAGLFYPFSMVVLSGAVGAVFLRRPTPGAAGMAVARAGE